MAHVALKPTIMNPETTDIAEHIAITKNALFTPRDVQAHHLPHCVIGYVLGGEKYIYDDNDTKKISRGELFFLGMGCHYTREVPVGGAPYEELLVDYSTETLQRILLQLNLNHKITATAGHSCEKCREQTHLSMPAWTQARLFFLQLDTCLREHILQNDPIAENLKMTELIYWMISRDDCCLRSKILHDMDSSRDNFQQTVHAHTFVDISVEDLARRCNRSLTSFKKEFARNFQLSPHQWFLRRRLIHARLLLISTDKSISQIGTECSFPNISHFIKLFRKQYDMTPAQYRMMHRETEKPIEKAEVGK